MDTRVDLHFVWTHTAPIPEDDEPLIQAAAQEFAGVPSTNPIDADAGEDILMDRGYEGGGEDEGDDVSATAADGGREGL